MRTEHLEILVELSKTQSMSMAGKNLHMSHQGISSSIASLENELGVTLVKRTQKGVYLTETGKKYVTIINQFLDEISKVKHEAADISEVANEMEGSLSIYGAPLFTIDILPKTISIFCKQYPKIELIIREAFSDQVIKEVEECHSEVGLVILEKSRSKNPFAHDPLIKFQALFTNPIYGLVAKTLPLASRKSVTIKELLNYPIVTFLESKNIVIRHIKSAPEIYGTPKVLFDTANTKSNCKAISQGLAVGFQTKYALQSIQYEIEQNDIIALPISDKINFICGYVTNSKCDLSPAASAFIDILKANC